MAEEVTDGGPDAVIPSDDRGKVSQNAAGAGGILGVVHLKEIVKDGLRP